MPTYEPRGVRSRGPVFPCETCRYFGPRPEDVDWGGECVNPHSDAVFWEDGGFWFTAPNDTCRLWEPVEVLSMGGDVEPKMFHGEVLQPTDSQRGKGTI